MRNSKIPILIQYWIPVERRACFICDANKIYNDLLRRRSSDMLIFYVCEAHRGVDFR